MKSCSSDAVFVALSLASLLHLTNAVFTCPDPESGPSNPLPAGTKISIYNTIQDTGCLLGRVISKSKKSFQLLGRSYNGRDWENTAGPYSVAFKFMCESGACNVTLPELEDLETETIVLTTYYHTATSKEQVSRFLQQATFGPTRAEIDAWNTSLPLEFGKWTKNQMNMDPTLHRAYYRERANARMTLLADNLIAPGDKPCNLHSRWKKYAFSWDEPQHNSIFQLRLLNNSTDWILITDNDGYPRTEVPRYSWVKRFKFGEWFGLCSLEETVGGKLEVTQGYGCIKIETGNPLIQFHETLPKKLVLLPDHARMKALEFKAGREYEYLLEDQIDSPVCNTLPTGGRVPVHALTSDNTTWYMHDPHVVMLNNTLTKPAKDGGGVNTLGRPTLCSNVPRTFLNAKTCSMSTNSASCTPFSESYAKLTMDDNTLRDFYKLSRRYIYALNMTQATNTPCVPGYWSRWMGMQYSSCKTNVSDFKTAETLTNLINSNTDKNPYIKDIAFPLTSGPTCLTSTPPGVTLKIGATCWKHVHNHHNNVYDFTKFVDIHGGGREPIIQIAKRGQVFLNFPYYKWSWHDPSRWDKYKPNVTYISRYGDELNFRDLPSDLKVESIVQKYGDSNAVEHKGGAIVCGSPGEVANEPEMGNEFDLGMDYLDRKKFSNKFKNQKDSVWNTVVLYSKDQLRQRMAWALSQILALSANDIDEFVETEFFLSYYDIFVRHAFGNYRDILREVAYSPLTAEMLTYIQSKSTGYNWEFLKTSNIFPDENFAREIMQLYTIGLIGLNIDGTPIKSKDGTVKQTYTNLDVMDNARAWTGFDRQLFRGNIESLSKYINRIDPMRIHPQWRDIMPKADIYGGYIGDGYPLCVDLPRQQFLKIGARYRLLGNISTPELQLDPHEWSSLDIKRVILKKSSSSLYAMLCGSASGSCDFKPEVTIEHNLNCDSEECILDQPRVVQLEGYKVFYEYVRPPCVQFPFYIDAMKIKERAGYAQSMCADPRLPAAEEACCPAANLYNLRASRNCAYTGERVSFPTALKRCEALGGGPYNTCTWRFTGTTTAECGGPNYCCLHNRWLWSSAECEVLLKVNTIGQVALIHNHTDLDSYLGDMRGFITPTFAPENVNFFRVRWRRDSFPSTDGSCNGQCQQSAVDDSCICRVSILEDAVFKDIPTAEKALDMLKIGAVDPSANDCLMINSSIQVKVWDCTGSGVIDENTVFEIKRRYLPPKNLKNSFSAVRINNGIFEFRNPPHFISHWERDNKRDVEYETDAVIDQIFNHPNTAPFLARRLIQRFGLSNPSPVYLKSVAVAFSDGSYTDGVTTFGTGEYGNLAATTAAILLHPEARAVVLDADPYHGSLREPLLKVMHLMRSLEIRPNKQFYPHIITDQMESKIGQMAHAIPSVFSFFSPDFVPPGRITDVALVSPEAEVTNTPNVIGLLNGMFSLIKNNLASCYNGFGPDTNCGVGVAGLTYKPPVPENLDTAIQDLNTLLTAGRLKAKALTLIKETAKTGEFLPDQLKIVEQLMITTPEFHTTSVVTRESQRPRPAPPIPSDKKHKAIVFFFMNGGADSYNILVPDKVGCPELYEMYSNARGSIAMTPQELSTPFSARGTQPTCDTFALHKSAAGLTSLYNSGEAILFANVGTLMEPVTKENWQERHLHTELFAHDIQQREAQKVDPFDKIEGTGILGRITDALTRNGHKVASLSIEGGSLALQGESGAGPLIQYLNRYGATKFDPQPLTNKVLPSIKMLNNDTAFDSNVFGELWSSYAINALTENEDFVMALQDTPLTTGSLEAQTTTASKMTIAAKLIKGKDLRGSDRDVFSVHLGAWDVHSDTKRNTASKVSEMDSAIHGFAKEMKAQGNWNDTVVVVMSEFGRTLTPNSGAGCDHGWGGNYWITGGAVDGGKILGKYPTNFNDLDTSRFRLIPTTPFDAIWNGIAEWFGVPESDMDEVLPNRHKFRNMFTEDDLFT